MALEGIALEHLDFHANLFVDHMATEIKAARIARTKLVVDLTDGRSIHVPIENFPTLLEARPTSRSGVQIGADRRDLQWKKLGLKISLVDLLVDNRPASGSIALRGPNVKIDAAPTGPHSRLATLLSDGKRRSDKYLTKGLFPRLTKAGRDKVQEMYERGCAPQEISREVMVSIASVKKRLPRAKKKAVRNSFFSR